MIVCNRKTTIVNIIGNRGISAHPTRLYRDAAFQSSIPTQSVGTSRKSIPFLTDALKDKESSTRRRAGWALVKIGAPAVKPLINSLSEVSKFTRERAALTLGWIGDERAVTALMWALKDKEPVVVSAAAWALGRIGHANALVALQELVNHADADVRDNAVEAIERIKD